MAKIKRSVTIHFDTSEMSLEELRDIFKVDSIEELKTKLEIELERDPITFLQFLDYEIYATVNIIPDNGEN